MCRSYRYGHPWAVADGNGYPHAGGRAIPDGRAAIGANRARVATPDSPAAPAESDIAATRVARGSPRHYASYLSPDAMRWRYDLAGGTLSAAP